jgi:hypothetical protein
MKSWGFPETPTGDSNRRGPLKGDPRASIDAQFVYPNEEYNVPELDENPLQSLMFLVNNLDRTMAPVCKYFCD